MKKDKQDNEDKIFYSKITGQHRPPCKRTRTREPNLQLMAKAIIDLYFRTKGNKA